MTNKNASEADRFRGAARVLGSDEPDTRSQAGKFKDLAREVETALLRNP